MGLFDRFKNPTKGFVSSPVSPDVDAVTPVTTLEGGHRYQLNTVGQVCPFPLVEAKQAIKQLEVGDELVIDFDCTQATDSIPHWAAAAGYPVTNFEQVGDASWTITVQKV